MNRAHFPKQGQQQAPATIAAPLPLPPPPAPPMQLQVGAAPLLLLAALERARDRCQRARVDSGDGTRSWPSWDAVSLVARKALKASGLVLSPLRLRCEFRQASATTGFMVTMMIRELTLTHLPSGQLMGYVYEWQVESGGESAWTKSANASYGRFLADLLMIAREPGEDLLAGAPVAVPSAPASSAPAIASRPTFGTRPCGSTTAATPTMGEDLTAELAASETGRPAQ